MTLSFHRRRRQDFIRTLAWPSRPEQVITGQPQPFPYVGRALANSNIRKENPKADRRYHGHAEVDSKTESSSGAKSTSAPGPHVGRHHTDTTGQLKVIHSPISPCPVAEPAARTRDKKYTASPELLLVCE